MEKILVIEDEQDIREGIVKLLQFEDFQTFEADNGVTGVALAKNVMPDLIVCDVLMPGLSGYGVLEELRSDPLTANLPFIFLTGIASKDDVRHGMTLGADDYLAKPFDVDELLTAIRTRLEKHAVTSQQMQDLRRNLTRFMPHELLTPLTVISGFAEFLRDAGQCALMPPEEIAEMGKAILEGSTRLQHLVENYLLYARLSVLAHAPEERTKWKPDEILAIHGIVDYRADNKAKIAQRQTDVVKELVDAQIRMPGELFDKIMSELLDNAFKFSKPGSLVHVKIALAEGQVRVSVADRGRGMTHEQVQDVEAYMQFERDYYEQQGTGLGLIIARLIAQVYGGELLIESAMDAGTTVTLTMPESHFSQ